MAGETSWWDNIMGGASTTPGQQNGLMGGMSGPQAALALLGTALMEYGNARQKKPAGSGMQALMGMQRMQQQQADAAEARADRQAARAEKYGQQSAQAALLGGYDPTSGITWDTGRQGMDDAQKMALLGRAMPDQFAQAQLAKMMPKSPIKLGDGETLVDPVTFKPIAQGSSPWTLPDGSPFSGGPAGAAPTPGARTAPPLLGPQPGTQTVPLPPIASPLAKAESGGKIGEVNSGGYAGKYQMGEDAAQAAGVYTPLAGPRKNAWQGTFNIPGMPNVKTVQDFLGNEAAQDAVFGLHRQNLLREIEAKGLGKYIGQTVGNVPVTEDGLISMMHLGGPTGTQRFLESGGQYNPADSNGTRLSDYGRKFANVGPRVQVAQANTGTMTDAAPAGPTAQPQGGQWVRPMNTKTGKVADFEVNTATGARRPYAEPDKAPSGYRYGEGGRLEPIPGGPQEPSALPFSGSGIEAQALNIVLSRDPATPEYAAAYAHLTQPKPTPVTMPDGTVQMVAVAPQLPPTIRPPAWMGSQPAAAPAPGAPGAPNGSGLSVTQIPGTGAKDPKFPKEETDAYGFARRLSDAEGVFRDLEGKGYTTPTLADRAASGVPVVGNKMVSEEYQRFDQAKRNFVNAILRRESGAAISASEFENADKQYFPQPGDSQAVIAQKRANRESAIGNMRASAGGAWDHLNKKAGSVTPTAPASPRVLRFDAEGNPVQ